MGALFSIFAVFLWVAIFSGWVDWTLYGGGVWWHSHEMLFGFVSAIITGFLLTAVQNWSGIPGLNNWPLFSLVSLWLIGRILLVANININDWIIVVLDVSFLPVAAAFLAIPILRKKLYRNLFFVPLLMMMAAANFCMHWGKLYEDYSLVNYGAHLMVILTTFLMCMMGGRVIPMFTANGTQTPRVESLAWLERLSVLSVIIVLMAFVLKPFISDRIIAVATFIAAVIHFTRLIRWRFWVTIKTPLVWSLHISYFCIALGMLFLSVHYWFHQISLSSALHVITVGAIGLMILSMISRVSLGHTGRNIVVGKLMAIAFMSLIIALIFRVIVPLFSSDYLFTLLASALFWGVGYGLFVFRYFTVLTRPRVDGRPG